MEPLTEPRHSAWPFPFVSQEWEHTPKMVQIYVHMLQEELTQLRACGRVRGASLMRTPLPPIGYRHWTRPTRSHASIRPPYSGRETGPPGAIARCSCRL